MKFCRFLILGRFDIKNQTFFADCQIQLVRAGGDIPSFPGWQDELVVFEQIENGDFALLLDFRSRRRQARVVQIDLCNT